MNSAKDEVLGIDLGTSYSCGCVYRNNQAEVLQHLNGDRTIASAVLFRNNGVAVGRVAKSALGDPNMCINAKRIIGRLWEDAVVKEMSGRCNAKLVEKDKMAAFEIPVLSRSLLPFEISSEIIKDMIAKAKRYLGHDISKLVVTVPAYFGQDQRVATKRAAIASGILPDSVFIINEPTAAALCYNITGKEKKQTVMVYDLGGGTFDLSIIKINGKCVEVIATNGNNFLGGDDFDYIIALHLIKKWSDNNHGQSLLPPEDNSGYNRKLRKLLSIAEDSKIILSDYESADVDLQDINSDGKSVITFTRTEMNTLLKTKVDETLTLIRNTLTTANITDRDIDSVILVGGSSKLLLVQESLEKMFGKEKILHGVNPDECVSMGATLYYVLYSAQIEESNEKAKILNRFLGKDGKTPVVIDGGAFIERTNISLGSRVGSNHLMDKLIPKGSVIPVTKSKTYVLGYDGQTELVDALFQGEGEFTKDCRSLAPIKLHDITPGRVGRIQLKYTYTIERSGIVTVIVDELPSERRLYGPDEVAY